MGQARTARALVGRVQAPVISACASVTRAHPSEAAIHAFVTGAHPSVTRANAFVKRAHRSCTGPQAVVSRHHSMCTRAYAFVTAHTTMCTAVHSIVIVFIRRRRLANKGRSYRDRAVARHNTIAIVSIRMCSPAGKEKAIANGCAGGCVGNPSTPGTMADDRANNPAHSREAADTAYQKRLAAERKAVIESSTSAAGCGPPRGSSRLAGVEACGEGGARRGPCRGRNGQRR